MSEYRVAKKMPAPEQPPDHAFVPQRPDDTLMCRYEIARDANDLPVFCNLGRRYHPLLEDKP